MPRESKQVSTCRPLAIRLVVCALTSVPIIMDILVLGTSKAKSLNRKLRRPVFWGAAVSKLPVKFIY